MRRDENADVARYFDRLGPIETAAELLRATAGLLAETGWVQEANAVDDAGQPTESTAPTAARFSVSSAMVRTSWRTGLDRTRVMNGAMEGLSDHVRRTHPNAAGFEAEESERRPTVRNLALIIAWNDDPEQTVDEIVRILLEVADDIAGDTTGRKTCAEAGNGKREADAPTPTPVARAADGKNGNAPAGADTGDAENADEDAGEPEDASRNATENASSTGREPVAGQLF